MQGINKRSEIEPVDEIATKLLLLISVVDTFLLAYHSLWITDLF